MMGEKISLNQALEDTAISNSSFGQYLFLLVLVALIFRLLTFANIELNGYDEQIYCGFVKILGENGIEGIRSLIRQFPSDSILSKGPSPLRILYIFTGMLICKLQGSYDIKNLAILSFISGIGTIAMGFVLFKKWFRFGIAIIASFLLVTSPLGTALSRRALQDTFFTFIIITAIFFYHQSWTRKKNIDFFMLGLTLLLGFLTKELIIFLYPSFLIAVIYYKKKMPQAPVHSIILPLLIAPLLYFIIITYVAGGIKNYMWLYSVFTREAARNEYAMTFQQGPWFRYVIDFILISPLTYIFSIVGLVAVLEDKRDQEGRIISAIYLLSSFFVFSSLSLLMPSFNIRWLLFLDVPLRALSVLGIVFIAGKINKSIYSYLCAICLILLVIGSDIHQFYQIFIKSNVYDPTTVYLLKANGF